jgi:tRNA modification GTPase
VEIDGIPFRLVDTAGDDGTADPVAAADPPDPPDPIVAEGVRRGIEARRDADQVLLVLDGSRPHSPDDRRLLEAVAPGSVIAINKRDLPPAVDAAVVRRDAPERQVVEISALTGEGIDRLLRSLASSLPAGESGGDVPVTRRRQHDELRRCHEAIRRGRASAREGHGEELILADLEAAVGALGRLTGELELEQVYDRIFSTFCIGK